MPTPESADPSAPWGDAGDGPDAPSRTPPVADAEPTDAPGPPPEAVDSPAPATAGASDRADSAGSAPPGDGRPDDDDGGDGPARPSLTLVLVGLGIALVLGASVFSCSHTEPTLQAASPAPTTVSATTTAPSLDTASTGTVATPPSDVGAAPARHSLVATVKEGVAEVPVYDDASAAADPAQTLSATGDYGQRQVFLVLDEDGDRLQVLLPVRPNGSRGWIDADRVDVHEHDYQIQVSLSAFRMVVQRGDEIVVDTPIGVGTEDTPTLGGEFYTWVLIDPTNAGYGSFAYGLSGFSTLEDFAGGDGRMGIHGTDDDSSIGRNVSHGCIRVPDDVMVRLVDEVGLPLGVPVTILA